MDSSDIGEVQTTVHEVRYLVTGHIGVPCHCGVKKMAKIKTSDFNNDIVITAAYIFKEKTGLTMDSVADDLRS